MAAMGLVGLRIPEAYGGQGAGCVATGIACEEVGRADFNATYLIVNTVLIAEIVGGSGTDEQKQRFLPPVANGEALPAICLTEPDHGSDAATLTMRAERDAPRLAAERREDLDHAGDGRQHGGDLRSHQRGGRPGSDRLLLGAG